jgi:hypothetical protein
MIAGSAQGGDAAPRLKIVPGVGDDFIRFLQPVLDDR